MGKPILITLESSQTDLESLLSGDIVATDHYVRLHTPWMLRLAKQLLNDSDKAEDAVQSAFINIFKNLQTFEHRSSIKTWMHRIVVNQSLMMIRKSKNESETSFDELLPEFENGCRLVDQQITNSPAINMERSQTRSIMLRLIDKLPGQYRIVLILRDIEGLNTSEVAELLELSHANTKVRLHRARSALKALLEPHRLAGEL